MFKVASFILSFIILFQSINFDLCDFNKLHNFVVDANCHIESGESFADFIDEHYNSVSEIHEHKGENHKHEEHGELPFKHKHVEHQIQLVSVFFTNDFSTFSADPINTNNYFAYKEPSTSLFSNSFFQPPQV